MRNLVDSTLLKVGARLVQVVGVPLACVLLTIYLTNSSNEREKIDSSLNTLNAAIAVLQNKTDNIYTQDDAKGDFALRDERMNNVGSRITDMTGRIDSNTHRIEALEAVRNRYVRPR